MNVLMEQNLHYTTRPLEDNTSHLTVFHHLKKLRKLRTRAPYKLSDRIKTAVQAELLDF